MVNRLPRPQNTNASMWVDEAIWGHRFYDEQTPWLAFLEFLVVAYAENNVGRVFKEDKPNSLRYIPHTRLYFRNILFNNPNLKVIRSEYPDENSRWAKWLESMTKNSAGIKDNEPDFSYVRERFERFSDFVRAIDFLLSSSIEEDSNKRWSSKFVFPYGPACLYEDLKVTGANVTNDRRFFARTGELLYLMLTRSGKAQDIFFYLERIVFMENTKWNQLVTALQSPNETIGTERKGAYLPYLHLRDYENLANDWLNILKCNLPGYDVLPYLVNITGLHLLMYFFNRAIEVLNRRNNLSFVLEILAPQKTVIRDLSADSYIENNNLSVRAIEKYIYQVTETEDWQDALKSNDPVGDASLVLQKSFNWPDKNEEKDSVEDVVLPEGLLDELYNSALKRHKQHVYNIPRTWGKEFGLSSSRGSRRIRYAPTDELLKTLVISTVPRRMEFQEFLTCLYVKYGFIIGDRQAQPLISNGSADQEAFSDNANRLEERLRSIGLLNRLSDACAYVINPFSREE